MSVIPSLVEELPGDCVDAFRSDGFYVREKSIFDDDTVPQKLIGRLEAVLNGEFETGKPPYKINKVSKSFTVDGRFAFDNSRLRPVSEKPGRPAATIHAINIWQADPLFQQLVTSPALASCVVRLMGWEAYGCRVAQDQIWVKPPHSGPLTYHRDTPYLDFEPKEVCTVWIPFDAVATTDVGTLEYCAGSHLWGDERRGSANQFYHSDYKALLYTAAEREACRGQTSQPTVSPCNDLDSVGRDPRAVQLLQRIVPVIGEAGCCSFHNGNTWHGSGSNITDRWRRGIGIHYIRGDAVFAEQVGKLWQDLRTSADSRELPDDVFPMVCPKHVT